MNSKTNTAKGGNTMKDITVSFGKEGNLDKDKRVNKNVFIKMSTKFRDEQLAELKGCELSVFICLALHMDNDFTCFVSNKTIEKETGYHKNSIVKAKRNLVDMGYLYVAKKVWTKELAYERYPVKVDRKTGKDKNKSKRNYILNNKLGKFASNTYSLYPVDNSKKEELDNSDNHDTKNASREQENNGKAERTPSEQESHRDTKNVLREDDRNTVFGIRKSVLQRRTNKSFKQEYKEEEFSNNFKKDVDNFAKQLKKSYNTEGNKVFLVEFYKQFGKLPTIKQAELIFEKNLQTSVLLDILNLTAEKDANIGYFFKTLKDAFTNGVLDGGDFIRHLKNRK